MGHFLFDNTGSSSDCRNKPKFKQKWPRKLQLVLTWAQPILVLVFFNMERLKLLPTTWVTEPPHHMSLSQTLSVLSATQPRTRLPSTHATQFLTLNVWLVASSTSLQCRAT